MAILVTGGAGYIGSHLVRQLAEKKEEVIVVDNLSTGYAKALIHDERLVQGDIRDPQVLDEAFSIAPIESVFHFAASMVVSESVTDPLKYYSNNVVGMTSLLQACTKHKVKNFVFSSTCAVYGDTKAAAITEDEPRRPVNPYGASKAICERILRDSGDVMKMNYAILRYFNVAGADPESRMGQRGEKATHLIKICCEAACGKRKFVEIYGEDYRTIDGTCVRDYIHVEDLASAHILVCDKIQKTGENYTLNVGYGKGVSVKEVLDHTWRVTGKSFRVKIGKRRPGDPECLVADPEKIKALGWKPRYNDIEKIILDAYNFEKTL